jgi:predicted ABC-type ATPase
MSGTPASGKSYVISRISDGSIEPRVVNTDKLVEFLKAYKADSWMDIKDTVKQTTKKQLALYVNSLLPLWVDGTSSSPQAVMKRNGVLKSLGYDTALIWIDTSLETSMERAKKRYEEGGREVPEAFIIETYKKLQGLKSYYASEFKHFTEILNDDGELIDKVVLQAYKKMRAFYNTPVRNPMGIKLIERMRENGHKYLTDGEYTLQEINNLISIWYR